MMLNRRSVVEYADRQFGRVFRRYTEGERAPPSRLRVRSARCSGASLCIHDPAFGGTNWRFVARAYVAPARSPPRGLPPAIGFHSRIRRTVTPGVS